MAGRPLLSLRFKRRRHRNKGGRVKCPWSPVMFCDKHKDCPMEDRGFMNVLEGWLLVGRDARTIDLEASGQGYGSEGFDSRMVEKAEIYRLFDDPDGVEYFLSRPGARMHKRLCKDLSRAKALWKNIGYGFSRKQSEKFYTREAPVD